MDNEFIENSLTIESGPELFWSNETTLFATKWNWQYESALEFQYLCLDLVKQNPKLKVFIFCNHPHCFTMGRGLQKGKGNSFEELVEFDMNRASSLKFPVYKIKRGGGLTFHYPGQWICYPIINLNNPMFSLKTLTYSVLEWVKTTLENEFKIEKLDYNRELLGLWKEERKISSVGIGIERFVTMHGIALNVFRDEDMFDELSKINPCGLGSSIYTTVNEHVEDRDDLILEFHKSITRLITTEIN